MSSLTTTDTDHACNRGRIQAQGAGVEKSVNWAKSTPLTLREGRTLLILLTNKLSAFERRQRFSAIIAASAWMGQVAPTGTGPTFKTFLEANYTIRPNLIKDPVHTRIDIEVRAGLAFVGQ